MMSTIPSKSVDSRPCRAIVTVSILTVAAASAVLLALTLTIFRPKDPTFTIYLVGLRGLNIGYLLHAGNLTRGIVIGVRNENYGSVSWQNLTVLVEFHDNYTRWQSTTPVVVGEIPIPGGIVSQRSTVNITTNVTLQLDKLEGDLRGVLADLHDGGLNFTCSVTASTHIRPFSVLPRIRGSISADCFGSLYINKPPVSSHDVFGGRAWCWTVEKRVM